MIRNYKFYLCVLLCFALAETSYGKKVDDAISEKDAKRGEKLTLYHEITNRKPLPIGSQAGRINSHDGLAAAKIVEVLEQNVQIADQGKQDPTLESQHLIQVTVKTPRKNKKMKKLKKQKHQKSKQTETMKNIKKRKQINKKTSKKRKYPKKYNAKKHGPKNMKDKKHKKSKSKHEKRNKKVSSKISE